MNPKRIMIVEDEMSAAMALEIELSEKGYAICPPVCSSEAALAQVEKEKPDLVLMDIGIYGRLNGIQTARIIRRDYRIPVVFMTGYHDAATLRDANEAGHNGYVVKPIRLETLMETIEKAVAAEPARHP